MHFKSTGECRAGATLFVGYMGLKYAYATPFTTDKYCTSANILAEKYPDKYAAWLVSLRLDGYTVRAIHKLTGET